MSESEGSEREGGREGQEGREGEEGREQAGAREAEVCDAAGAASWVSGTTERDLGRELEMDAVDSAICWTAGAG